METIIQGDNTGGHIINQYKFKVLSSCDLDNSSNDESDDEFMPLRQSVDNSATQTNVSEEPVNVKNEISTDKKDELVESLLKKTDEMSSNFIKMQMKLESKDDMHKLEIEKVKKTSFDEGYESGKSEAIASSENIYNDAITHLQNSIKSLDDASSDFSSALEAMKADIFNAALDIAKEVIYSEISENSKNIALSLAQNLMNELKEASHIKLKVNPNDHGFIDEKLGSTKNIEIISDSAVERGGVVAMSDIANLEDDVLKRYEKVKQKALS